jgi:putative aldouronate transport system substrate-binding protein
MKKAFAMLLSLAMVLSLMAGCGSTAGGPEDDTIGTSSAEASEVTEEAAEAPATEEAAAPAEEASAAEEAPEAEEEAEKGPFVAGEASLPLADGATLSYFVELPGYMSMFNVNSYDDIEAFQYAEEITGVDIEFTIVNSESMDTNFQLMVASGDITDMVAGASQQYTSTSAMIEDGVAIDLMEYQDQLPNYWNVLDYYSAYKTIAINQNGEMPEAITVADDYKVSAGLQIRKDWLDELGLEVPQTYDEMYEALTAFKNEKGADHALLLLGDTQITGTSIVGGLGSVGFYQDSTHNMYVEDGVVMNGFLSDGYKEYMEMIAKWYSEGLIASDFATESNDPFTSNSDSYIQSGNAGIWSAQSDNMDSNMVTGKELDPDYEIVAMPEPEKEAGEIFHFGDTRIGSAATGKNVAISECCEDVDLALAWIDFWYTEEGRTLANYGLEGVSFEYNADGEPEFTDAVLHNDQFPMLSFATTYYTLACVPTLQDYDRLFSAYSEANLAAMDLWTETSDDLYTMPSQVELDTDEANAYSEKWSDISTYASTEVFKFVMGEYNFDEDWDAFIAQLEDMGLEDCIDLYQEAYDRYEEAYAA